MKLSYNLSFEFQPLMNNLKYFIYLETLKLLLVLKVVSSILEYDNSCLIHFIALLLSTQEN